MKYYESTTIQVSEDTANTPSAVRFSDTNIDTDVLNLKHLIERSLETYPVGTTVISMGSLAQAKWFFIKPISTLQIAFDGGSPVTFLGGKASKMWINFSAVSVIVPSGIGALPIDATLAIAG